MPTEPLIDFDALDLSNVLVDQRQLRTRLLQRGRFAMVDAIVHMDVEGNLVVGYKDVRHDEWWTEDHIPGRPIFPGTLMIEGAAQMCTYDFFERCPDMLGTFVGFGGVDKTRFRRAVEPDCRLVMAGRVARIRSRAFTYHAQGFVDGTLVFQTEVMGVVV